MTTPSCPPGTHAVRFNVSVASQQEEGFANVTTPVCLQRDYPHKLQVHYAPPGAVAGSPTGFNSDDYAAQLFSQFDYVVFGLGLADPANAWYQSTRNIIEAMHRINPAVRVLGYIDIGTNPATGPTPPPTMDEMKLGTDQWKAIGADDVFCDRTGYDQMCSRARMNEIVTYIHQQQMGACLNAWNPEDVFDSTVNAEWNPAGTPTTAGVNDYYMLESWVVNTESYTGDGTGGSPRDGYAGMNGLKVKADKCLAYRETYGTKMIAINMVSYAGRTEEQIIKYERMAELLGMIFGLDAYGTSDLNYAAVTNVCRRPNYVKDFPAEGVTSEPYLLNSPWTVISREDLGAQVTLDTATAAYAYSYRGEWWTTVTG